LEYPKSQSAVAALWRPIAYCCVIVRAPASASMRMLRGFFSSGISHEELARSLQEGMRPFQCR
jgi:hypothetical protein